MIVDDDDDDDNDNEKIFDVNKIFCTDHRLTFVSEKNFSIMYFQSTHLNIRTKETQPNVFYRLF